MIMGYNPVPLQYQRYGPKLLQPIYHPQLIYPEFQQNPARMRSNESADGNGELNLQQGYHPQAIPMVMIPAMIPAPYLPHMNQNI